MADNHGIDFPDGGYEALIFDLDGTLAHSMPAHFEAWCRALDDHGAPGVFPEDIFYAMGGRPTRDIVGIINGEQGLRLDPEAIAYSKRRHFLMALDQVQEIPSVVEFARNNHGKVPMAVASGGARQVVEKTLELLGILDLFDAVVAAEDVEAGKPAPDPFLEAAKRMGVEPGVCVVFEDAPAGIAGALAAGMRAVTVPPQEFAV